MRYAENTAVSSEKSRNEIERTLTRYGAEGFLYGWQGSSAVIAFEMAGRSVKFVLPLPAKDSPEFTCTPSRGTRRRPEAVEQVYEQAVRQRWRALALVIKAKLEAVESGITTLEDEFMAHIVLPDGQTVGAWMRPQITKAYELGQMPSLFPSLTRGDR